MSDTGPTQPLERPAAGRTSSLPPASASQAAPHPAAASGADREQERTDDRDRDPVELAKQPDNRAKLALATAVLTLLNTLLLLGLLAAVLSGPGDEVVIDGERCLINEVDGENVLYCQR